jgi:signal peptidase
LAKISITKGVFKDVLIVVIGVIAIWVGLQVAFGTQNPFYVVASGSMVPRLMVYDVLVVQGHEPFEDIKVGDIIVFNRPSDHNKVIVHRVASIIDYNPKTIRTKGDANPASIPGTDFPITEKEYIGKVAYVIPQLGYVTQVLRPPTNYIIIAIVIGFMVMKHFTNKKDDQGPI